MGNLLYKSLNQMNEYRIMYITNKTPLNTMEVFNRGCILRIQSNMGTLGKNSTSSCFVNNEIKSCTMILTHDV